MHKALVQPHLLATVLATEKDPAHPISDLKGFRIQLGEIRNALK